MANIKNLFVADKSNSLPKNCWFVYNGETVRIKNIYYNFNNTGDVLVWKNSDYLAFVKTYDPSVTYETNTIIFEGFSDTDFMGEYRTIDSPSDVDSTVGQVYVQEVENEEN